MMTLDIRTTSVSQTGSDHARHREDDAPRELREVDVFELVGVDLAVVVHEDVVHLLLAFALGAYITQTPTQGLYGTPLT